MIEGITVDMELNALSQPLRPFTYGNPLASGDYYDLRDLCRCTVFHDKYTPGGEPAEGVMALTDCLLEEWESDAHFAQYVARSGDDVRCLKSESESYDLEFRIMVFDADYRDHGTPTDEEFAHFVMSMHFLDGFVPNIVYRTRHGARVCFRIAPIRDPLLFEALYASILKKLAEPAKNAKHGFLFDEAVKDWTRLFRAAKVVRDGKAEYDYPIRVLHNNTKDVRKLPVRAKKKRKPVGRGNKVYDGDDLRLISYVGDIKLDNRNNAGFKACCHCLRNYQGEQLELAMGYVREAMETSGLDDQEIEQIINNAYKAEGGDR